MSRIKDGYKVLAISKDGSLESVLAHLSKGSDLDGAVVRYSQEQWVRPNKGFGPMAVFVSEQKARAFLNGSHPGLAGSVLYKCKFRKSTQKVVYTKGRARLFRVGGLPPGTVLASSVMILTEEKVA